MERKDYTTYDAISSRAAELLSQLEVGDTFDWRTLFGEPAWTQITADKRAQTVGDQLARHFARGPDPVVEFDHTNRSPRYSVWRKIREVDERG